MSLYVTVDASGLYTENCWYWVADHDLEDPASRRVTVFAGRGALIFSQYGRIWLSASNVEHHSMYQYQFANTQNIYIGFAQTETPYFQPHPLARFPFPAWPQLRDPDFQQECQGWMNVEACEDAWGMRVLSSANISVYGAGFYSFFNTYNDTCSARNATHDCQGRILSVSGDSENINFYDLSTVGTKVMVQENGTDLVASVSNKNTFADTLAVYRT
jgi:glucan 1,3-beta-glucosidase